MLCGGCAQLLLDEETRKKLRVCTTSGIYEWLRMPFGPAPAPALMQGFVQKKYAPLVSKATKKPHCTPLMDDIVCSSPTFEAHVSDMNGMFAEARSSHMEFKFNKAQLNQSQVELWGSICDKDGRRPMPKKVTQIIK